jgi:hypothetical protein
MWGVDAELQPPPSPAFKTPAASRLHFKLKHACNDLIKFCVHDFHVGMYAKPRKILNLELFEFMETCAFVQKKLCVFPLLRKKVAKNTK